MYCRSSRRIAAILVVLVLSAVVRADETATSTNRLPVIVVNSTRLPGPTQPVETLPANVTVLDNAQINDAPAFTLPELLRQQTGLVPIDQVGLGQGGNVTLRGYGEKNGLLVLVDGVRMNDAGESGKAFSWNSIPLDNIERIEVIRGGGSTVYGEGAIAGVLNIITKKAVEKPVQVTTTAAAGNLGYYNAHVDARGQLPAFDYILSGDRQEWTGWRDASSYRGWSGRAGAGFPTGAGRFEFNYFYHDDLTLFPDALTLAQYQADPRQGGDFRTYYTNTVQRGTLDYRQDFASGWTLLAKVFGQTSDTDIVYDDTVGFFDGFQRIEQPNFGTTWQLSGTRDLAGRPNLVVFGVEAIQQDFSSLSDYGFGPSVLNADNWTVSVFVQDTWTVLPELSLTGGVRYDHREWDLYVNDGFSPVVDKGRYADVWSPQVGLTWSFAEQMSAWLQLSRSFRLPTGNEIGTIGFFDGLPFYANPDIDPVASNTIEIGTRIECCRLLSGSLAWYYSAVENDILFNPFLYQNQNFDSIRQGVELTLNSMPADWIDFYYTTAFTDARFDGGAYDDQRLPLVAEWQLTGGVNWRPVKGLQLTFEVVHVRGQQPSNDLLNQFEQNDYTVCNARASYQWQRLTLFARANNVLDERYETYPLSNGAATRKYNPAPGVSVQAGATITF